MIRLFSIPALYVLMLISLSGLFANEGKNYGGQDIPLSVSSEIISDKKGESATRNNEKLRHGVFIEAESFDDKGGWVVDQQFMDVMGSPYLMAHGMGNPVKEAVTEVIFPELGKYHIYIRTYNWTAPWTSNKGAGKFTLSFNGKPLDAVSGMEGDAWEWQYAGEVNVETQKNTVSLIDLSGFNGRCDAIFFSPYMKPPPNDVKSLKTFREEHGALKEIKNAGDYDFVVCGGGIAGMCAAVSAARLGMKVALINNRPILGGNNSSEIRVHLGGRIESDPYKNLGNLIKEFGPTKEGNAQPAEFYEDMKKEDWIKREKNISLFPSCHVYAVNMEGSKISSVEACHIETGERFRFFAPFFADCTGDGTIGYLSKADYSMGRESREEFDEPTAPEKADKITMGASVQWYSRNEEDISSFPEFSYGLEFNHENVLKVSMGEWDWETGMNLDQIQKAEEIRDYGLMVVYSNWSFLKNHFKDKNDFKNKKLSWVAYIAGKRESRRLLGDHILTENDLRDYVEYPDGSASTTWSIDLHYPEPGNAKKFPYSSFKSIAKHIVIHPYPIPYRCLYSRNVSNLFMAGRNISVTHVALGTVRVMRTTGMMGEVTGMAAYLCKKHKTTPRGIYQNYLIDLQNLMKTGTGKQGLPNNQKYNQGSSLSQKPGRG